MRWVLWRDCRVQCGVTLLSSTPLGQMVKHVWAWSACPARPRPTLQLEELKRQQSDKLERLRDAEAAVRGLQAKVQGAEQAKQQLESQLHRSLAERWVLRRYRAGESALGPGQPVTDVPGAACLASCGIPAYMHLSGHYCRAGSSSSSRTPRPRWQSPSAARRARCSSRPGRRGTNGGRAQGRAPHRLCLAPPWRLQQAQQQQEEEEEAQWPHC